MDEREQSMSAILTKTHESFSTMARRGYRKHGRGAIFVWESEGEKPFTAYRASYQPQSDHAFINAGPHPAEMTRAYDPATELVVVFVDTDENVHTVRLDLAQESPESQFKV
jgi:hypothetical protein